MIELVILLKGMFPRGIPYIQHNNQNNNSRNPSWADEHPILSTSILLLVPIIFFSFMAIIERKCKKNDEK